MAKSFPKGRNYEFDVAKTFRAHGSPDAEVNGIYDPLDVHLTIDGERQDFEVKRRKAGMTSAYKAIANDAYGQIYKADYQEELATVPLKTLLDLMLRAGCFNS